MRATGVTAVTVHTRIMRTSLIVLHLHRQQDQLGEDHQQQDGDVPVAVEERLHAPRAAFCP